MANANFKLIDLSRATREVPLGTTDKDKSKSVKKKGAWKSQQKRGETSDRFFFLETLKIHRTKVAFLFILLSQN